MGLWREGLPQTVRMIAQVLHQHEEVGEQEEEEEQVHMAGSY